MATRNRKSSSTENIPENPKKSNKKVQNEKRKNKIISNKNGTFLGILIIIFSGIYIVLFGNYIYKRKTGQTASALNNSFHFHNMDQFNNIDMNNFRRVVKVDDNGKFVFTEEDIENKNEVFVDINGNVQVPPSKDEIDEVNQHQMEKENESGANAQNVDGESQNTRQKRSVVFESGNGPDEDGEMSTYLKNMLTRGPSANFVDLLRNKIVILNSYGDDVNEPTSFTSTHQRYRRSINQHMYASGIKNNKNVCNNVNTLDTDICY